MALCQRMKQISCGKKRPTENSTPEIEIMAHAMLEPPTHPRKQVKRFRDVSKNHHNQATCAK
jgi:hypothetical protein